MPRWRLEIKTMTKNQAERFERYLKIALGASSRVFSRASAGFSAINVDLRLESIPLAKKLVEDFEKKFGGSSCQMTINVACNGANASFSGEIRDHVCGTLPQNSTQVVFGYVMKFDTDNAIVTIKDGGSARVCVRYHKDLDDWREMRSFLGEKKRLKIDVDQQNVGQSVSLKLVRFSEVQPPLI